MCILHILGPFMLNLIEISKVILKIRKGGGSDPVGGLWGKLGNTQLGYMNHFGWYTFNYYEFIADF